MKQIMKSFGPQTPGNGSVGKIWGILTAIGFIIRIILKLTEPDNNTNTWERRE